MVDLHRIPNVEFASWGERNSVRLFFPGLYNEERHPASSLTQDEQRIVYNDGLCPAMHDLMEHAANDWPPTYADELFRAKKRNGSYSFTKKGVPSFLLPELGNLIRFHLEDTGHAWGGSMRFLSQIRGTKHITQHALDGGHARTTIRELLDDMKLPSQTTDGGDQWYIDVGVEFSSTQGDCLQWRTDQHTCIVEHALEINRTDAVRVTKLGSSEYERDIVAHLTEISGCRITTGNRSQGPCRVRYLQLYPTDKALTYSPENGHYGKYMTVDDALAKAQPPAFTTRLRGLYINAMRENASHCRIELRVPLAHAETVLLNFPPNLLERSIVAFPRKVWW